MDLARSISLAARQAATARHVREDARDPRILGRVQSCVASRSEVRTFRIIQERSRTAAIKCAESTTRRISPESKIKPRHLPKTAFTLRLTCVPRSDACRPATDATRCAPLELRMHYRVPNHWRSAMASTAASRITTWSATSYLLLVCGWLNIALTYRNGRRASY
jgi:hypothetical protein